MMLFFSKNPQMPFLKETINNQKMNFLEGQKINFPEYSIDEAKNGVYFLTIIFLTFSFSISSNSR